MRRLILLMFILLSASPTLADGPADNNVQTVRQIPPPGIELKADVREQLEASTQQLREKIDGLKSLKVKNLDALLVDIEIFFRAADQALRFKEIFKEGDVKSCEVVLSEGHKRADELKKMNPYWLRQHGFVVRGYRSKIDGTVQPYGLEIPASYRFDGEKECRCDLWLHGRGETVVEVQFIAQRMKSGGPYPLEDGIVLHPFGRYSNAFKFAGEVDVLEALEDAKQRYRIDEDRISVRGFSMGGAGCWQMAMHYSDMFFAANPGAGFSETPEFLKFFQGETLDPPDYERKLWNLYDAPGWAINIHQIPTIAYSGEIDKQKQAADIMEAACKKEGMKLTHIIGPETGHKISMIAFYLVSRKMNHLAERGRQSTPTSIHFATYTLKYNRMNWLMINALDNHWQRAEIIAHLGSRFPAKGLGGRPSEVISVRASNVSDFSIDCPAGTVPFNSGFSIQVTINGKEIANELPSSDSSYYQRFVKNGEEWQVVDRTILPQEFETTLRKRHNLQGPIDDAFMDSFLFVKPTGEEFNDTVKQWVDAEFNHAVTHWRQQMRGDARVKNDVDVTDQDIAQHNLILWGSPSSNSVYKRIADQLPIQWNETGVSFADKTYPADHAPIMIYPNPLNRDKYIVTNSSFTYREYDYLNNARQTPKLPDWAIIDLKEKPNSRYPGKVVEADFFNEEWRFK